MVEKNNLKKNDICLTNYTTVCESNAPVLGLRVNYYRTVIARREPKKKIQRLTGRLTNDRLRNVNKYGKTVGDASTTIIARQTRRVGIDPPTPTPGQDQGGHIGDADVARDRHIAKGGMNPWDLPPPPEIIKLI